MKKILTLAYLVRDNTICLAMKKRGFGEGETVWETVARGCRYFCVYRKYHTT